MPAIGISGAVYADADKPAREPQIMREMSSLEKVVCALHEELDLLTSRLETISRPIPPAAEVAPQKIADVACPLGNSLRMTNERLQLALQRLQYQRERLEI